MRLNLIHQRINFCLLSFFTPFPRKIALLVGFLLIVAHVYIFLFNEYLLICYFKISFLFFIIFLRQTATNLFLIYSLNMHISLY